MRTDNCATVDYINRQGGVRSAALLKIVENLLVWGSEHLLSLRALHVPHLVNRGTDVMLRGSSLLDEVVQQIWNWFSRVEVDLFASGNNTCCLLWFFLTPQDEPPLGVDRGTVVCRDDPDVGGPALIYSPGVGGFGPGGGLNRRAAHVRPTSPGLAPERDRLMRAGL